MVKMNWMDLGLIRVIDKAKFAPYVTVDIMGFHIPYRAEEWHFEVHPDLLSWYREKFGP